jgi:hypothetical protein
MSLVSQIWNDRSLWGQGLVHLPENAWNQIANGELITYQQPEPGSAQRKYCLFEMYSSVTERWPSGNPKTLIYGTNFLPAKYLEMGLRKITGAVVAAGLLFIAAPLGFAINVIQQLGFKLLQTRHTT